MLLYSDGQNVTEYSVGKILLLYRAAMHALHASRSYRRESCPSVHPSLRLSDKRVICDKTKESCAYILIPHERTFILILR